MKLAEIHESTMTTARSVKEQVGREPLPSVLLAFRGLELVAQVHLHDYDSQMLRRAMHMTALGFAADRVAMAFEGWDAHVENNPDTGRRWEAGEMQAYVSSRGGVDHNVGESILVHVANAAGDSASGNMPFSYRGQQVIWGEEDVIDSARGGFPVALTYALSKAGETSMFLSQIRRLAPQDKSDEYLQASADAMCAQVLSSQCHAVVVLFCREDQLDRLAVLTEHGMAFKMEN